MPRYATPLAESTTAAAISSCAQPTYAVIESVQTAPAFYAERVTVARSSEPENL
jgi:hypothetical protein